MGAGHVAIALVLVLGSDSASAQQPAGGGAWSALRERVDVHGFGEVQLRGFAEDFDPDDAVMSQWANVLNLEIEVDVAPDGWGPFDLVSAFSRIEVRYECVYRGCGLPTWRYWGNRATSAPRNLTDGSTNAFSGTLPVKERRRVHSDNELVEFFEIPPFDQLRALGATNLDATFAPIDDGVFAVKGVDASRGNAVVPLGPWLPKSRIDATGSLASVPNPTLGLPLRPAVSSTPSPGFEASGLYVPSAALLERDFDETDQNLDQQDLIWNHGGGQDEQELKELYLDLELFDSRLWVRAGKQSIVWGKTELFRTTDQFNPQDLALSSLPTLEESRLPQWSVRGVWSFFDVGPLEDVRLEVAVNFDDFEPLDLGRCGEPYTIWLACARTFGLWAHGFAGVGISNEDRPPDPGQSLEGWEIGGRVEFRIDRFSFQISNFYGFDDAPVVDYYNRYERRVDLSSGRPLDVQGRPLDASRAPEEILASEPANRQLFDVVCSSTLGIAASLAPALADSCLVDLLNAQVSLRSPAIPFDITPAAALGTVLGGSMTGEFIAGQLAGGGGAPPPIDLVELNADVADGTGTGFFAAVALARYLTDEQEALIGCGPFWATDCDEQGIDLFHAEASVLLQSFPQFEPGGPVATYPVGDVAVTLPGANGPLLPDGSANPAYDPVRDGCVLAIPGACEGRRTLIDPRTGQPFPNEMAALSFNFLQLLAVLSAANPNDPGCDASNPISCSFVRGVFDISGVTRPEVRAGGNGTLGRRDFVWSGGSQIQLRYFKRNVLGFAFDFAEDVTKTNWSVEATWFDDQPYAVTNRVRGWERNDTYNLTLSVDRPTFVNFLNPSRTFFFNSQVFVRYIAGYRGGGDYIVNGPWSALFTLSAVTGYHQDRLLPQLTWVHDVRSSSGAVIQQLTFRFTNEFSATLGVAAFYGKPERIPVSISQVLPTNLGGTYESDTRFNGLTPIAERDEVFLLLRYTF